jgi:hypothetical protein
VATTPKGLPYPLPADSPPDVPAWMQSLATKLDSDFLTAADASAAYVKQVGGDTITPSAAGVVGLVVKGRAGQTANLLEVTTDAGVIGTHVRPGGALFTRNLNVIGDVNIDQAVIQGAPAQTGNLLIVKDSSGNALTRINAAGGIEVVNFFDAQAATPAAQESNVILLVGGSGLRRLVVGAADSAGAGFRTIRVAN